MLRHFSLNQSGGLMLQTLQPCCQLMLKTLNIITVKLWVQNLFRNLCPSTAESCKIKLANSLFYKQLLITHSHRTDFKVINWVLNVFPMAIS